jgi:hypothetical protein
MRPRSHRNTKIHSKSGIYKLICQTCKLAYIGQTSPNLQQRYQEHIRYVRNNDPQSAYAHHILSNQLEYGNINEIMTLLKTIQKSSTLIPYEQFCIHSHHQHKQLITEHSSGKHNPLYQLAIDATYTSYDDTNRSIHASQST